MALISKHYLDCFTLEKSKLDRLVSLSREKLAGDSNKIEEKYRVRHIDGTYLHVDSLDHLYRLHNSGRKQIEDLSVELSTQSNEKPDETSLVELKFSGDRRWIGIDSVVMGSDSKWVSETFALLEEQVERCIKRGFMYIPVPSSILRLALLVSLVVLIPIVLLLLYLPERNLAYHMWLSKTDIQEIAAELKTSPTISADQSLAILNRQIANLNSQLQDKPIKASWPIFFVIAPLLIILGAFAYLIRHCYPRAVFIWGDMEEWYQTIQRRKAFIWNTIFASTLLSVVSGLFLMGVDSFFK